LKIIFKSSLVGLSAAVLAILILFVVGSFLVHHQSRLRTGEGGIGWDPVSALTPLGFWIYLLLAFTGGFWLMYRSLTK
jgi:hypothetical protein